MIAFFFSSRRRHTRWPRDWSSDVCSSDLREDLIDGRWGRECGPELGVDDVDRVDLSSLEGLDQGIDDRGSVLCSRTVGYIGPLGGHRYIPIAEVIDPLLPDQVEIDLDLIALQSLHQLDRLSDQVAIEGTGQAAICCQEDDGRSTDRLGSPEECIPLAQLGVDEPSDHLPQTLRVGPSRMDSLGRPPEFGGRDHLHRTRYLPGILYRTDPAPNLTRLRHRQTSASAFSLAKTSLYSSIALTRSASISSVRSRVSLIAAPTSGW